MSYFVILSSSVDESFHITLLPEFFIDTDKEGHFLGNFVSDAEFILSGFGFDKGFSTISESEEIFTTSDGAKVPVVLVNDDNKVLLKAHSSLLYLADLYGAKFANNSFIGEGYSPHISGADLSTKLPVFDTVSLSKPVDESFEKQVLEFD